MIKKLFIGGFALLSTITSLSAQTIQVDFPHFAGKEYRYLLDRGDKKDTIASGKLDEAGKTTLVFPFSKKGYAGLSHFLIKEGAGVEFIVNNENFTISCSDEQPSMENIKYTVSTENNFVLDRIQKQKSILEKAGMVQYALKAYKKEEPLYPALEKEKSNLDQQFTALKSETTKSPLYAARFAEIYDFLSGVGSSLDQTEDAKAKEMNTFVIDKMDFGALYTSSLWSPAIESWSQLQQNIIKDDAIWLQDTKKIFVRIRNNGVYTAFAEKMVAVLSKAGKDEMVMAIGEYVKKSGRIENPGQNLQYAITGPIKVAPVLQTATGKKVIKNKTLLFFFESGCNNCENEIHQLIGNYQVVKNKGYEVITVSADLTANAGDGHSHEFPWKEQLCDYKGFAGINFKNYGVIGTPTFFIVDAKGKISGGPYARLIDTGIL
ncbi:peroxiredoxin family protein [Flavobacterium piscisymbiosum]|uniref:Redoxin domain-containing protein n=1 Tax=Flavobacterium piscisymbiosum TaxID=2893753 RepID=A0ABS8MIG6_9FLAO|nr:thioredoxin-like domain-containing protein [Flavobacterium sp. F-30]MCC9065291.1 redoxin domain-containing protein [Flavobacterium sp. F-30]